MNKITLTHVEIIKIWGSETSKNKAINLSLRDFVGTHPVYFQTTFYGQAAITVEQTLTVGDYIDISGNIWVKPFKTSNDNDGFIVVIDNPVDLFKLSLHTHIDLSGPTYDYPKQLFDNEDVIPF